jgi:hypothetical protein
VTLAGRPRAGPAAARGGARVAAGLLALALLALVAGCAGPELGPVELVDPTEVRPPDRPNNYLVCPPGLCAAPPAAASPEIDRPLVEVERVWLEVVNESPRVEQLAHDPTRHLYLFVQRTPLLGFPDLISVRFLARDARSSLAVYSRSVYGYWDLGVNRRRVENWLAGLRARLAGG